MGDFHTDMRAANVYALWERENRHNRAPQTPHVWCWSTMGPLIDRAVAATDMRNAERRVLVLRNPGFANTERDGAAINLSVNLQVLMPGEKARPHRHSMNAIRFVLEGSGATTIVEGKDCPMQPGDMILTPAWTWHEHQHGGSDRAVWVDALDVPVHTYLDTGAFEAGPIHDLVDLPPDSSFFAAGLTPDTPSVKGYSPLFRYPWDSAVKVLESLVPNQDGSRRLRYTNPRTGGAVMTMLDCYLLGLTKGRETYSYRTNSNCVCVVMEGEGFSQVGEERIAWGPKDVFTLPHNQWISHTAAKNARLFQITDRELLRRLDLLWDETRDDGRQPPS